MLQDSKNKICVVIGASHAGVNFAFNLRRDGWQGDILVFDSDPEIPYHRPPLSKTYITSEADSQIDTLFPEQNYIIDAITLKLGKTITSINKDKKTITLSDGIVQTYDKLVIATGARPFIPPIAGIETAKNLFPMRTYADAIHIKKALNATEQKRVVIIGGGYIGLETAASLKKMGADVTVLERETRVLARITAPEMSEFFQDLHTENGVSILSNKNVISIENTEHSNRVICDDNTTYLADVIVVGVGIKVNVELAKSAGLEIENGIKVDETCCTSNKNIYAIGDCTFHFNPHYNRFIRLESVQNAVDQAKVAAASICKQTLVYNTIPWFWSDQYDVKLQMVGLSTGYNQIIKRVEDNHDRSLSIWYFKDDELLAVDAVNNAKAYVLGGRFITGKQLIDKAKLQNSSIPIKPTSFLKD
ncbi:ferredoxin reductase [Formosa agariphila KMM 3901]|uniref:Ferredoxin reductase n=1 Tax=Formosa agariphila (strain DSM 15362 / KCTC 12365 / LMG 23005 / KMM 3901 / M-2Alg 35-1) TaxID=1347342 RepID=T2KPB4_FORAG|nr:FAD/NAD(P)-binding oxidoreductase [Formosa agariphila]CDF79814.1 ferredoxin reductase [Formosa agariphila KMM 3901]